MKVSNRVVAVLASLAVSISFACAAGNKDADKSGKVSLALFSNKPESISTLQGLIDDFQKENPNIAITLTAPPQADTILMTRLSKNDIPDIMSVGGNATFGELARNGVYADLSSTKYVALVQPAYVDMLQRLVGNGSKAVYGIPYASNANGVIYNKDKLQKLGANPPKTWDEFIAILEKAKKAGETPIMFTLQDAWTSLIPWNSLASNLVSKDFPSRESAGKTTFAVEYKEVATKIYRLTQYGHSDNFGIGYGDGNTAFANGKGVFLLQGNWAIPEVLKANPKANLGVFPFPVSNDASKNNLVSGVDVLIGVSAKTKHPEAAAKFVDFMLRKETAARYIKEQSAFSAVKGVYQLNPVMDGYKESFEKGKLSSFADHYYPSGYDASALVQGYLMDGKQAEFLAKMDEAWKTISNR